MPARGPRQSEQLILFVVRRFNCTPLEAIREFQRNPWLQRLIETTLYEDAYHAVERWDAMDADQQKAAEPPSGTWVERVAATNLQIKREEMAERKRALKRAGRA